MTFEEIKSEIRKTVQEVLPNCSILLFGSYALGKNNFDSDIDLLLISKKNLTNDEKCDALVSLHELLAYRIRKPFDILLNSEDEVERKKVLPGHIIKTALREGILL